MTFSIVIVLIAVVLLIATLIYVFILNQQLKKNRHQLETFIENFSSSLNRAELTIKELKELKDTVLKTLIEQRHKASVLKDELIFILDRGENIAQKLEKEIRDARRLKKPSDFYDHQLTTSVEKTEEEPALVRSLKKIR
ncbi:MAG: hypothetical protein J0H12_03490 [Candidatus Paracaedimonas acanthamoebae]|uniref:DUF6468 domain-containing protein n=1 Tax=Candidatus Paracaedimonas acanthamoebae TaxID=244581 RepID=A0A8J7TTK0_9PROT|nr:hypothetical protein [Candidatus Paracaedimonas acanthamoebae]